MHDRPRTTATEAGLLAAIAERPVDDFPRQVYADWLDDQGRAERAELIRLQLALARDPSLAEERRREQELLAAHGQRWMDEELPGWDLRPTHEWMKREEVRPGQRLAAFRRGLVGVLFLSLDDFLKSGKEHAARVPTLARVQLTDRWPAPPPALHWRQVVSWRKGGQSDHAAGLPSSLSDRLLLATGSVNGQDFIATSADVAISQLSRA